MTGNSPTFAAANLQWVGVAAEAVYGTPIAQPTLFLPADTPVWTHPTQKMLDQALRGSMATDFQQINGIRYDQVTFKTYLYLDSIFFLLRSTLGLPDVMTGTNDPYTHKTSLQSGANGQPASTTVFWYDAAGKCWQMPGAQISDLKFTFKTDGLVEVEVTYVGLPAAAIAAPTNTPTQAAPSPGWNSTISIGGNQLSQYSELDLEIKRATEMIPTINGTQSPMAIFAGPVSVSGSLTAVYQGSSDVNLADEMANTQPAIVITTGPVGDATHHVILQMSKVAYDSADPAGTNKWMEIKSAFKGLANATDVAGGGNVSPILATLLSPIATAI